MKEKIHTVTPAITHVIRASNNGSHLLSWWLVGPPANNTRECTILEFWFFFNTDIFSPTPNCRDYLISSVVELRYSIILHILYHVGLRITCQIYSWQVFLNKTIYLHLILLKKDLDKLMLLLIQHSHYCFPVSLYYSNILVLLYVFCPLTTSAYFHRFQPFWYQNVQLLQEIYVMTFGVYNFYTFQNI